MNFIDSGYDLAINASYAETVDGITVHKQQIRRACDNILSSDDYVRHIVSEIVDELESARKKFPENNVMLAVLMEEVGELATAMFSESADRVRAEAIQVAAMAIRVALDGDSSFDSYRERCNLGEL